MLRTACFFVHGVRCIILHWFIDPNEMFTYCSLFNRVSFYVHMLALWDEAFSALCTDQILGALSEICTICSALICYEANFSSFFSIFFFTPGILKIPFFCSTHTIDVGKFADGFFFLPQTFRLEFECFEMEIFYYFMYFISLCFYSKSWYCVFAKSEFDLNKESWTNECCSKYYQYLALLQAEQNYILSMKYWFNFWPRFVPVL